MPDEVRISKAMNEDEYRLLAAIIDRLPSDVARQPLVLSVELVWIRKLGEERNRGALVLTTGRTLTLNGGDGWTGLDGLDSDHLASAVNAAINDCGVTGMIDRFVVRASCGSGSLLDPDIDQLFD